MEAAHNTGEWHARKGEGHCPPVAVLAQHPRGTNGGESGGESPRVGGSSGLTQIHRQHLKQGGRGEGRGGEGRGGEGDGRGGTNRGGMERARGGEGRGVYWRAGWCEGPTFRHCPLVKLIADQCGLESRAHETIPIATGEERGEGGACHCVGGAFSHDHYCTFCTTPKNGPGISHSRRGPEGG